MWQYLFLTMRRILLIYMLTLIVGEVKGQSRSQINRYFIVEFNEQEEDALELIAPSTIFESKPLFALKTNLLFDALTMVNIEIEVPIQNRWSIAGEFISPWWTMDNHRADSKRNRLQIINGNLEGRYWWGERAAYAPLTGWFTGLYSGLGTYDVEYNKRGYQGDIFFTVGASGGYAHPINRSGNLRMEYSLSVGYFTTYYHYYEAEFCENQCWHAVEMREGRYKWFGPTRAKVSLSWLIDRKFKR